MRQLVDRVHREWLEGPEDQPTRMQLNEDLLADAVAVVYDDALIGPEELETLGAGQIIEVDSEEMLVTDIDEDANTLTVIRAVNGTGAVAHTAGAFIFPGRLWRRRAVFDALCDEIVNLWPDLWRVVTTDLVGVSSSTYNEVPAEDVELMVAPMWVRSADGLQIQALNDADYLDEFPASATGKAFFVPGWGARTTQSGYLTYKARFPRPVDEIDDLQLDLGVEAQWERLIIVGAVAYLLASRELDSTSSRRLTSQLEAEGYPAGTASQLRDSLLRYRELLVERAREALQARYPVRVSMRGHFS